MKTEWADLDDSVLDVEDYEVLRDLQLAAVDAIRKARRFGTNYVIWEDNRIKSLKPHETHDYERRALEHVERLNQKIAACKSLEPESAALVLNERPDEKKPSSK